MVGFVGFRAGNWTGALESDWEEAHQARAVHHYGGPPVSDSPALWRGGRGFGEGEKLERGDEMGEWLVTGPEVDAE
jgi:hypothetical protein